MPPPRLFGGLGGAFKNGGPADCCTQQFSRESLGHYSDKRGKLDSNGLEI